MFLILALVVVILAIGGGIAVNPLLFLLLVLAAGFALGHTHSGRGTAL